LRSLSSLAFHSWIALVGALLLLMALSSAFLRRLPISSSAIYLGVGIVLSPVGLGLLRFEVASSSMWLERLAEVAVIVSLFVGGLRLRLPLRDPAWRAAFLLAGPVMLLSILGVAFLAHVWWSLPLATALLAGAILAPTDPVLASSMSVNDAKDKDRMRYGLSGEAGLNDGMAFPFVVFALLWAQHGGLGVWTGTWFLERIVWAVPAALVFGFVLGRVVGRVAIGLRSRQRDTAAPNDFLALALIALSYVGAEAIGAWGFLAVFAAGVGLRSAEIKVVRNAPHPEHQRRVEESRGGELAHPPAEDLVAPTVNAADLDEPAVAAGVLVGEVISFGDTLERLLEVLLVVIVGVAVVSAFTLQGAFLALALLVVIRPVATWICLAGSPTSHLQRVLMGWFGIRGIGSIYYLTYALNHGAREDADVLVPLTMTVIATSVLLHGITGQPILKRYERSLVQPRPDAGD
jgi:NhaP-type Na+/H+ or K+/H+ antiporter